jgi:hypothetical protein
MHWRWPIAPTQTSLCWCLARKCTPRSRVMLVRPCSLQDTLYTINVYIGWCARVLSVLFRIRQTLILGLSHQIMSRRSRAATSTAAVRHRPHCNWQTCGRHPGRGQATPVAWVPRRGPGCGMGGAAWSRGGCGDRRAFGGRVQPERPASDLVPSHEQQPLSVLAQAQPPVQRTGEQEW